jgi:hypothetical protein
MGTVCAEVEIDCPVEKVYAYLKNRYTSEVFRSACMQAKGYVPDVACVDEREGEQLKFTVSGRDSLLRFKVGSWWWTYRLTRRSGERTAVLITYGWSVWLSLLSAFTLRPQAANEIAEAALALDALATR